MTNSRRPGLLATAANSIATLGYTAQLGMETMELAAEAIPEAAKGILTLGKALVSEDAVIDGVKGIVHCQMAVHAAIIEKEREYSRAEYEEYERRVRKILR